MSWISTKAQNPERFAAEIQKFSDKIITESTRYTVFTGSSSIRMWQSLHEDCPREHLINTGFGGSHMSDLLYYLEETILRFNPDEVYIYEGDNDIAAGKSVKNILETTRSIIERLKAHNPSIKIYLISAKPSPARWQFQKEYEALNMAFHRLCSNEDKVQFMDIWDPMLDQNGRPKSHIFVQDSLHMNSTGYKIWADKICREFTTDDR